MMRALFTLVFWCAVVNGQGVYTTAVAPREGEDLAGACRYELTIPQPGVAVRAIWVIFDRGREVEAFYNDPEVYRFAERERIGLLLARHCRSKEREDINVDPGRGMGRSLFSALEQLGRDSGHGEVQSAKLIAFGFSGAGALVTRLPGYAPDHMLAVVAYAPGQYEPLGVDTIALAEAAAAVPQLVIANSNDPVNGTRRPLDYFTRHFGKGAPWVFAIQNGVPHHGGLANTKPLILAWLAAVLNPTPQTALVNVLSDAQRGGWRLYLRTEPTATLDEWRNATVRAVDARVEKASAHAPAGYEAAGWVATKRAAAEWLGFVRKSRHPVDTKYP